MHNIDKQAGQERIASLESGFSGFVFCELLTLAVLDTVDEAT